MLAHCTEYLDSVGDNSLNLAATTLGLNAYMLTGDEKYRDGYWAMWAPEGAYGTDRRQHPSNVGLDGKPGGEYGGRW